MKLANFVSRVLVLGFIAATTQLRYALDRANLVTMQPA